jgi:23S rRNA G2445 N2-methylase RlmL
LPEWSLGHPPLGGISAAIDNRKNTFEVIPKKPAANATMGYKDKEDVRGYENGFVVGNPPWTLRLGSTREVEY